MNVLGLSDSDLLYHERMARIRAWDAKSGSFASSADAWHSLHAECRRRGLTPSTTETDFYPTSEKAKLDREYGPAIVSEQLATV